ncbi:hypothetical protein CYMTET_39645, partial [Cymbomonas tetramitiformis]
MSEPPKEAPAKAAEIDHKKEVEKQHYGEVAASAYEEAFFYSTGPYQEHLLDRIESHLALDQSPGRASVRVVDLGGGTGNFTQAMFEKYQLNEKLLCVDKYQEMLDTAVANNYSGVNTLCADAVDFSQDNSIKYDRILLKEIVHHVPNEDIPKMFGGIFSQLTGAPPDKNPGLSPLPPCITPQLRGLWGRAALGKGV